MHATKTADHSDQRGTTRANREVVIRRKQNFLQVMVLQVLPSLRYLREYLVEVSWARCCGRAVNIPPFNYHGCRSVATHQAPSPRSRS